ncbi:hypothetical protein ACA910_010267 [Epithemia clementina (nom. ined.)]
MKDRVPDVTVISSLNDKQEYYSALNIVQPSSPPPPPIKNIRTNSNNSKMRLEPALSWSSTSSSSSNSNDGAHNKRTSGSKAPEPMVISSLQPKQEYSTALTIVEPVPFSCRRSISPCSSVRSLSSHRSSTFRRNDAASVASNRSSRSRSWYTPKLTNGKVSTTTAAAASPGASVQRATGVYSARPESPAARNSANSPVPPSTTQPSKTIVPRAVVIQNRILPRQREQRLAPVSETDSYDTQEADEYEASKERGREEETARLETKQERNQPRSKRRSSSRQRQQQESPRRHRRGQHTSSSSSPSRESRPSSKTSSADFDRQDIGFGDICSRMAISLVFGCLDFFDLLTDKCSNTLDNLQEQRSVLRKQGKQTYYH